MTGPDTGPERYRCSGHRRTLRSGTAAGQDPEADDRVRSAEATIRREHTADDLARVAGRSRFAPYRGFRAAYGFAPSDHPRDL
ncbi:hypothetical protein [Streptomyces sp. NWU49]|uniref:hypothetical protein n=1 Tax=Streptomyces sp. NWU49 TaxID=2201153 RepID=UPI001C62D2A9|nr:hypothetical protein [Streptomyces sp. NWU49]